MLEISLIIPTYGRKMEVEELLNSLTKQDCNLDSFEVLIMDQNDTIDLEPVASKYAQQLNIHHIKVEIKGIAHSKNMGLKLANANIVTFPDDDCTFYPDTISTALKVMGNNPEVDILYGQLYDRSSATKIMRNWSNKSLKLNKINFHLNYSAVTCFSRQKQLFFDERFGVGSKYGVGEELDYVMQALNKSLHVIYTPLVEIWHPQLNVEAMTSSKAFYYAKGYGATFRKNFSLKYFITFFLSCFYQLFLSLKELTKGDRHMFEKRWLAFKGRLIGFYNFK